MKKHIIKNINLLILIIFFSCALPNGNGERKSNVKSNAIIDKEAPVLTKFLGPSSTIYSSTFLIQLEGFDNSRITGWLINYSNITPSLTDSGWQIQKPSNFILPAVGDYKIYAWAKDANGNVSNPLDIFVSFRSNDIEPPVVIKFVGPTQIINNATFNIDLDGTDNIGISNWLITKTSNQPSKEDINWSTNKPSNYTLPGKGQYTIYAWAKDDAGNINTTIISLVVIFESNDKESPVITKFNCSSNIINNTNVNLEIEGSDNVGITKWLLKDSSITPAIDDLNWISIKPINFIVKKTGINVIYIWAKDDAGNISNPGSLTFNFQDTEAPVITQFSSVKETSDSIISIDLNGSDNIGVQGWLINESSSKPDLNDIKWSTSKPSKYNLTSNGKYILYAWAKDASGNISNCQFINVNKIAVWTIFIHMAIDNELDYIYEKNNGTISAILSNLENQKKIDTNNKVNILILMDCYNSDTKFKDGYYKLTGGNLNSDVILNINEINSGNINDVNSFIDWGITNYPASNYFYSIIGQGSGFDDENINGTTNQALANSITSSLNKNISINNINKSIAIDSNSNDSLSYYEIGEMFKYFKQKTNKNIEIFLANSWLMGQIELAFEIKDYVNYFIASEEILPIDSWSPNFISSIISNPQISSIDVGKNICDSASQYFSNKTINFTLSLVDLSKIMNLSSSINTFSLDAVSYINGDINKASYFNNAAETSFIMCSSFGVKYYYLDLGCFFNNIYYSSYLPNNIKNDGLQVLNNISNAIIYKVNYGYPLATGLSIYHNIWNSLFQYPPATYYSILLFGKNNWTNYIALMSSLTPLIAGDQYEPDNDFSSASNIIKPNDLKQNHTLHATDDVDCIKLDLTQITPGKAFKFETYYLSIKTNTQLFLYNSAGNLLVYNNDIDSSNLYSRIIWTCTTPGLYYIRIKQLGSLNNGDYTFDFVEIQ